MNITYRYNYKARGTSGKRVKGWILGSDRADAIRRLEEQGLSNCKLGWLRKVHEVDNTPLIHKYVNVMIYEAVKDGLTTVTIRKEDRLPCFASIDDTFSEAEFSFQEVQEELASRAEMDWPLHQVEATGVSKMFIMNKAYEMYVSLSDDTCMRQIELVESNKEVEPKGST